MAIFLYKLFFYFGRVMSLIISRKVVGRIRRLKYQVYTGWRTKDFKQWGKGSIIIPHIVIRSPQFISVGNNTVFRKGMYLTLYKEKNSSEITIGDNCDFGEYNQITACNGIHIGNGLLTGKFVIISDNSHGKNISREELDIKPSERPLFSKGEIIIGNNVWIGDKVSILAGVEIGDGAIIGTGAIVTKNIPPYSVAVGNPAHIIKTI